MYFVSRLPNGVMCLSKKSDELPDGTMTFGDASEYYDNGRVSDEFRNLPKFAPKLLLLSSLADDV